MGLVTHETHTLPDTDQGNLEALTRIQGQT